MIGSVAGVGQFLETVGVPGPQVGTQTGADNSGVGQDFASALQQAGGPTAQELATPANGREDAKSGAKSDPSAGTKGAAGAQEGSVQDGSVTTAGAGKSAAIGSSARRSTVGQLPGNVGRGLGAAGAATNLVGSKQIQNAAAKPVEIAVAGEIAPLKTEASNGEAVPASLSGTAKPLTAYDSDPAQVASVVTPASAVAGTFLKTALAATPAKAGEEPKATAAKPTIKAVASVAVDSKLTALVPQGTIDVAQGANLSAAAAPLPAPIAAVPSAVADEASDASRTAVTAALGTPAAAAAPVPSAAPMRVAGVQAAGSKQPKQATADLPDQAASVEAVTTANAPVAEKIPSGQVEAPAVLPAQAQVPAAASERSQAPTAPSANAVAKAPQGATTVPGVPAANAAPAAQPAANQTVTAPAGSAEQANVGFQAAVQTVGIVGAIAPKPGLQAGRTAVPTLKAAGETVPFGSANAVAALYVAALPVGAPAGAVAAAATPVTSAVPVPAQPAVAAHVAVAGPKASLKNGEEAAPVQGAPPAAKVVVAAEGVSTPEAPAKSTGDTGHAVVTTQPAGLPGEPVATVPVVAASVPVPVAHEAGAGSANAGVAGLSGPAGPAGTVAGAQEAGGAAGLPHTTLSSSPTSLEVAVASGTHGWLKIRAELNATGEVNASLTGATPAAAEKLRGELPALSDYLQGEKLTMGTLDVRSALHTVATVGESSATFGQAGSGQESAHQGGSGQTNTGTAALSADAGPAGGRAQQQTPRGADVVPVVSGTGDEVVPDRVSDAALYANSMELGDNAGPSSVGYGAGGGWLNVRA